MFCVDLGNVGCNKTSGLVSFRNHFVHCGGCGAGICCILRCSADGQNQCGCPGNLGVHSLAIRVDAFAFICKLPPAGKPKKSQITEMFTHPSCTVNGEP